MKRSDSAYGAGVDNPDWQVLIAYDTLRQPVARDYHGIVSEDIVYAAASDLRTKFPRRFL